MSELVQQFEELLGPGGVLLGDDVTSRPNTWRGGNTEAVPLMSMAVLNSALRAISNGVSDGICGYDST